MSIWKGVALAAIGIVALAGCSRQESAADAQRRADAAAIKGSERVTDAKRDAANAEIKASEAVAKAEDKAAAQVDQRAGERAAEDGQRGSSRVARPGAGEVQCRSRQMPRVERSRSG